MVSGNYFWDNIIKKDMDYIDIGKKKIYTYLSQPISMYDILEKNAGIFKNKAAIIDDNGNSYSYQLLLKLTDEFSLYLNTFKNIKEKEHVGILIHNSIEFCIALMSISKLSAVSVIFPSKYKKSEIISLYEKSDVSYIICGEEYANYFDNVEVGIITCKNNTNEYGFKYIYEKGLNFEYKDASQRSLQDNAIIMFTSGTTSKSKAVLLKNYNLMHAIVSYKRILDITENDISIIATPIYHITGIIALFGLFIYSGGTLYLHKTFKATKVLECVKDNKLTLIHASPTVFSLLIEVKEKFPNLPSLKKFACGSSNMAPENIMTIKSWLPNVDFHTIYGLTETSSPGTIFPIGAADSQYIGSSGVPIPGFDVKIVNEENKECNNFEKGEIYVRGTVVLENYYKFDDNYIENGWLKTGDIGYLNDDGYLYVVDRKKDMINRGGEKICSFDIENEIYKVEGVLEAAVVARQDAKYGEVPVAMIKLANGYNYDYKYFYNKLIDNLAKYQIPVDIIFTKELPKTANGKLNKTEIKKILNTKRG